MTRDQQRDHNRQVMLQLLTLRKHYPYRMGVIQAAVLFGVITDTEWQILERQIVRKVKEPKL